jgi:peptide/nickel transport system permease protein
VLRRFLANPLAVAGAFIVVLLFVVAFAAPVIAPWDPYEFDAKHVLEAPSASHWLGTDGLGRDVLSRMLYGARVSLLVGFVAVGIATAIGLTLGALAGFFGGLVDGIIMRFVDVMLNFPTFFLVLAVIAYLDASIWNIMVVIGLTSWMGVCRLVRAEVLSLRQRDFMVAAERAGAGVRLGNSRYRRRDPARKRPVFPRSRRAAADRELGKHPHRRKEHAGSRMVAVGVSRRRDPHHGARLQPARRGPSRRARSEAESTMSTGIRASTPDTRSRDAARAAAAPPLLGVEDLVTTFQTADGVVRAVDGVSFSIAKGETVALVGESGCGKSVTALSIMRLVQGPAGRIAGGRVLLDGVDLASLPEHEMRKVRGARIGMIFQEPMTSLNPVLTIGFQIAEAVQLHKRVSRAEAWREAVRMLDLVEIADPEERARSFPHQLSGGMRQRVMIAIALSCGPELLIADEPTTALDVTIQAQILELLDGLRDRLGMALLLITHDLGVVAQRAERVLVMYAGRVIEEGPVGEVFSTPRHPYTRGLLRSVPRLGQPRARLDPIPGYVPRLSELPSGCRFRDRCELAQPACADIDPPLERFDGGRRGAACIVTMRLEEGAPR